MASNDFRSLLSTFQAASSGQAPASNNSSLLEATTQLWRIQQLKKSLKSPQTNQTITPSKTNTHIAICLCIVDDLPHADVWKYWINSNKNGASLYIHAKHPEKVENEFTRAHLLPLTHKPDWNDFRIIKAMLSLAQEALKDPRVTHVYFGTESCLPITSTQTALDSLQPSKSYLQYYDKHQASRFEERECWSPLEQFIPQEAICKALPGWCVICRNHLESILKIVPAPLELCKAFEHVWAPEELYFATALSLLGLLHEVENKSLIYVEWNERARNHQDRAHPREFVLDPALLQRVGRNVLFVRKVKQQIPLERWKRLVLKSGEANSVGDKRLRNNDSAEEEERQHQRPRHTNDNRHHDDKRPRYREERQ